MIHLKNAAVLGLLAVWAASPDGGALHAAEPTTQPTTQKAPLGPKPAESDGFKLVWSDEFNTDGPLNPKDWNFEKGFQRNNELQWYQPENAVCEKGMLVITGKHEIKPNPNYEEGSDNWKTNRKNIEYTASSVTTSGKHLFMYGRFEMRARIDTRDGSWPAFWFLGRGRWPAAGEIDVMEYYKSTLLANIGWQGDNDILWNSKRTPLEDLGKDWGKQFHVWRMDWDADNMTIWVDQRLLNHQDLSKTVNHNQAADNPFHHPMYILVNQAIGSNGGDPSKTQFPTKFEVDYVRVYQTSEQAAASAKAVAVEPPAMTRPGGRRRQQN